MTFKCCAIKAVVGDHSRSQLNPILETLRSFLFQPNSLPAPEKTQRNAPPPSSSSRSIDQAFCSSVPVFYADSAICLTGFRCFFIKCNKKLLMAKPFQAGGSLNRSMTTKNQAGNHVEQQRNESDIKPSLSCCCSIDDIDEESPNVLH